MQCLNSKDRKHVHTFDPQEGDSCWARLDPHENVWSKGMIIRKVTGVPDSFVVEVDGCRYRRNKHDLTLTPPSDNNDDSVNHSDVQSTPMAAAMMPTL